MSNCPSLQCRFRYPNQVISKRMVKKQQMRWTPKGAHLLLQVRTRVLDGDWRATFERWYPELAAQAA